jgi:hypothetical protein
MTPEVPAIATAPAAEVFKKLRREDCVISAPLIVNQFIADPHMKKPPEGGLFFLGCLGRNRTINTRIFKYPPIDRFRFDSKDLRYQLALSRK